MKKLLLVVLLGSFFSPPLLASVNSEHYYLIETGTFLLNQGDPDAALNFLTYDGKQEIGKTFWYSDDLYNYYHALIIGLQKTGEMMPDLREIFESTCKKILNRSWLAFQYYAEYARMHDGLKEGETVEYLTQAFKIAKNRGHCDFIREVYEGIKDDFSYQPALQEALDRAEIENIFGEVL